MTFVIERATENFVCMPLQDLHAATGLNLPEPRGLIATRRDNPAALWIETNLGDLGVLLVSNQYALASPRHGVVPEISGSFHLTSEATT